MAHHQRKERSVEGHLLSASAATATKLRASKRQHIYEGDDPEQLWASASEIEKKRAHQLIWFRFECQYSGSFWGSSDSSEVCERALHILKDDQTCFAVRRHNRYHDAITPMPPMSSEALL